MRKAITRRTIDHCASIMRFVESLHIGAARLRTHDLYAALQPTPSHIINVLWCTVRSTHGSVHGNSCCRQWRIPKSR